jgi:hypothetical protein
MVGWCCWLEDIRVESLKVLVNFTEALGARNCAAAATEETATSAAAAAREQQATAQLHLHHEQARAEAEQLRCQTKREKLAAEADTHRRREPGKWKRFKESTDAQRRLKQLATEEAATAAAAVEQQRGEMQKLSTTDEGGK